MAVIYLDNRLVKGMFTNDDASFLMAVASHLAISIEVTKSARLEIERRELHKNLEVTGAVQSLLVPQESKYTSEQFQLLGFYRSASQSGGDWWWYEVLPEGSLFLALCDVTGHGAGSAMVTAAIAGTFFSVREKLFQMTSSDEVSMGISEFVKSLDRNLRLMTREKYLSTYSFIQLDPQGTLRWWGAGAPMIQAIEDSGTKHFLECSGYILGLGMNPGQVNGEIKNFSGRILTFSDGLLEIESGPSKGPLSEKQIHRIFTQGIDQPLENSFARVESIVDGHIKQRPAIDDISFIFINNSKLKNVKK